MAMSGENVEAFKRGIEAGNRRDMEALGRDSTLRWNGIRRSLWRSGARLLSIEDTKASAGCFEKRTRFSGKTRYEFLEIRDLGDRVLARGRARMRGKESGAETEAPISFLVEFETGKATRLQSFPDPKEALEAAGLEV
jgi:ketosteroid isomerase-like protein